MFGLVSIVRQTFPQSDTGFTENYLGFGVRRTAAPSCIPRMILQAFLSQYTARDTLVLNSTELDKTNSDSIEMPSSANDVTYTDYSNDTNPSSTQLIEPALAETSPSGSTAMR